MAVLFKTAEIRLALGRETHHAEKTEDAGREKTRKRTRGQRMTSRRRELLTTELMEAGTLA